MEFVTRVRSIIHGSMGLQGIELRIKDKID